MIITRAYKTKLFPTNEQLEHLIACCDVARYVYNWALGDRKSAYEEREETVNHYEQKRRFNAWKYENAEWVTEWPYVITESAFAHLDTAYKNFFRRVRQGTEAPGFPKFKSRHNDRQSFTLRGAIKVERDRVKLPKLGWIELQEFGYLPTSPTKLYFATISTRAESWYISLQCDVEVSDPPPPNGGVLGIDSGYGVLITTSEGEQFDNLRLMDRYEKKITRLNRELHRRKKGSANRAKTKAKIAKLHAKIADARNHHAHNISRVIADKPAGAVAIEGMNIRNMMEQDESYVKRAKKLADAGVGELRRQVTYKSQWAGKRVVITPRDEPTNRRCSTCGEVAAHVGLVEKWTCPACGVEHDRRCNTAHNMVQYAQSLPRE